MIPYFDTWRKPSESLIPGRFAHPPIQEGARSGLFGLFEATRILAIPGNAQSFWGTSRLLQTAAPCETVCRKAIGNTISIPPWRLRTTSARPRPRQPRQPTRCWPGSASNGFSRNSPMTANCAVPTWKSASESPPPPPNGISATSPPKSNSSALVRPVITCPQDAGQCARSLTYQDPAATGLKRS